MISLVRATESDKSRKKEKKMGKDFEDSTQKTKYDPIMNNELVPRGKRMKKKIMNIKWNRVKDEKKAEINVSYLLHNDIVSFRII